MTADEYLIRRRQLGLSQDQLAARLGVTRRTICRRERRGSVISTEAALAIRMLQHDLTRPPDMAAFQLVHPAEILSIPPLP